MNPGPNCVQGCKKLFANDQNPGSTAPRTNYENAGGGKNCAKMCQVDSSGNPRTYPDSSGLWCGLEYPCASQGDSVENCQYYWNQRLRQDTQYLPLSMHAPDCLASRLGADSHPSYPPRPGVLQAAPALPSCRFSAPIA